MDVDMTTPEYQIERDIVIEAPVEVVWRTITEPDQIRLWFADRVELDIEPGARGYLGFGEQGGPVVVETVDPPTRFSFRWNHPAGEEPAAENSLLVEFILAGEGERTHLLSSRAVSACSPGPTSTSGRTPTSTTTAGVTSSTAWPGC
jgi:uncharacterized protein YndB with AHSA1/START domain